MSATMGTRLPVNTPQSYLTLSAGPCNHPDDVGSPAPRFWAKVQLAGPDECWLWTSTRSGNGYGQFWLDGRYQPAHQIAIVLATGQAFPQDAQACHHCDVPLCVNVRHLFVGTAADNARDKAAKGRAYRPIGALHPMSKLTADQVLDIRSLVRQGVRQRAIAELFGITQSNVSRVASGKSWAL